MGDVKCDCGQMEDSRMIRICNICKKVKTCGSCFRKVKEPTEDGGKGYHSIMACKSCWKKKSNSWSM